MNSFDLTFNGAVLPGNDPAKVKQDFARLFSIEDGALLEKIFSGQTIILGHNLDRKTAADYFRKIKLLGGQAAIVKTPILRSVKGDELLVLDPDLQGKPEPEPEPDPEPISADPVPELPSELPTEPPPEPVTPLATPEEDAQEEPSRLEALREAKRQAQRAEARLLRQKEQYNRIALEEIEKIDQLQREVRATFQQECACIKEATEAESETLSARLAEIDEQKAGCKDHARRAMSHLDDLIEQKRKEDAELSDMIGERLEATRESSLEEVRRLEQQIEEAQLRAEADIADLEQQLQGVRTRSQAEIEVLQEQKAETLRGTDGEIDQLEQQGDAARQQSESERAILERQEQDLRDREMEESRKLEDSKADIQARREKGIAGLAKELTRIREQTREILQELGEDSPAASGKQDGSWAGRKEVG